MEFNRSYFKFPAIRQLQYIRSMGTIPEGVIGGNLYSAMSPGVAEGEEFTTLISTSGLHIRRIVSTGQSSPDGFWYDQPEAEWVALISGEATLRIEGEPDPRELKPGDWIHIPARCRHRVEWTSQMPPAVWIAVHFPTPKG